MIKKICLSFVLVSFLIGCNTKFSVNGEYVEQPVVHFLLDQGQEFHFLKLNKTFLREGNAYEFAKNPDLSYFDDVVATVQEVKNGNIIRTWTLQDTTIQNKKEGVFYSPAQKLYFFKANDLDEEAIYRLEINIDNGNHIVKGQTELVKEVKIVSPQQNVSLKFASSNVLANGYVNTPINFSTGNGAVFKAQVRFTYKEHKPSGSEDKSILWTIGEKKAADIIGSSSSVFINGEAFYELVRNKIAPNEDVTKRTIESFELLLTAGSSDLQTYILTNEPTSSLAQNKPVYSNVEGALGIFSSRVTISQFKKSFTLPYTRALDSHSTRELCNG